MGTCCWEVPLADQATTRATTTTIASVKAVCDVPSLAYGQGVKVERVVRETLSCLDKSFGKRIRMEWWKPQ
jgi:hypothetical protein